MLVPHGRGLGVDGDDRQAGDLAGGAVAGDDAVEAVAAGELGASRTPAPGRRVNTSSSISRSSSGASLMAAVGVGQRRQQLVGRRRRRCAAARSRRRAAPPRRTAGRPGPARARARCCRRQTATRLLLAARAPRRSRWCARRPSRTSRPWSGPSTRHTSNACSHAGRAVAAAPLRRGGSRSSSQARSRLSWSLVWTAARPTALDSSGVRRGSSGRPRRPSRAASASPGGRRCGGATRARRRGRRSRWRRTSRPTASSSRSELAQELHEQPA